MLDPSTVQNIPPPPQQPRDPLLVPACGWMAGPRLHFHLQKSTVTRRTGQWAAEAGTGWGDLVVLGLLGLSTMQ